MKKSDFIRAYGSPQEWGFALDGAAGPVTGMAGAAWAATVAERAGVTWDPEEPEGFREWFDTWNTRIGDEIFSPLDLSLEAWNACLARQEAQGRAIFPEVDPEARRKEIEAQIEAWIERRWPNRQQAYSVGQAALRGAVQVLLRDLGVL